MTTEEKAKAYDEALKWMRELYPELHGATKEDAEHYFPELRESESEDERIRKALVKQFGGCIKDDEFCHTGFTYAEITAWLEKQQEIPMPNSTELIEMWEDVEATLKEHENDPYWGTWRIAYNAFLEGFGKGYMVKRDIEKQKEQKELPLMDGNADLYFDEWNQQNQNPTKRQCFEEGMRYAERLQKEQKQKTIGEYHKVFDRLYGDYEPNLQPIEQKPAWSEEDENYLGVVVRLVEQVSGWPERAITEYTNWLKSLRPQPKQEVTDEEIEEMVTKRARSTGTTKSEIGFYRNGIKDAIKRFGLRSSWKPSEEHLSALLAIFNDPDNIGSQTCQLALTDLYEQLKKL